MQQPLAQEPGLDTSSSQQVQPSGGRRSERFQGWYELTAPPVRKGTKDAAQREQIRQAHFLSLIVLCLLPIFVIFIPACFVLPNPWVMVADLSMIGVCLIVLILNRAGYVRQAGSALVVTFELALALVILTTWPLDEPSLQQYELFVFGELLAVSLLPAPSVFPVAIINSLFIAASLLYQPHTVLLDRDVQTQFWPMLVRPIAVQFLVAGVTYLWVNSASRERARAARAERLAMRQKELAEQERQQLKDEIARICQQHAKLSKERGSHALHFEDLQHEQFRMVLWPLVGAFNSLWSRLLSARQTVQAFEQLDQAIAQMTSQLDQNPEQPFPMTKTPLDGFLAMLNMQRKQQEKREVARR